MHGKWDARCGADHWQALGGIQQNQLPASSSALQHHICLSLTELLLTTVCAAWPLLISPAQGDGALDACF